MLDNFFPWSCTENRETMVYMLAHELAHVYYLHPVNNTPGNQAEDEANKKAVEWGVRLPPGTKITNWEKPQE